MLLAPFYSVNVIFLPFFSPFHLYIRTNFGYNTLVIEIYAKGDTNYGSH